AGLGSSANPNFIGTTLEANANVGVQLIAPDYVSPRSVQINIGVQRQLGRNTVISVDYARNVDTHTLLAQDTNKVGDARFLNVPNAQAAISATNAQFGCATIDCAITAGATISDYASNGLDSGGDITGGSAPCGTCAFPGINAAVGQNQMLFPIGR